MDEQLINTVSLTLKKDDILFLAEDNNSDVFIIKTGEVMVFVQKGSQITPVAFLGVGEFIGELSFFDDAPRSASIICTKDSEFVKISNQELNANLPQWLKMIGLQLARKIREGDELIRSKGIRKKNVESIKPLEMGDQTRTFKLVDHFKKQKS